MLSKDFLNKKAYNSQESNLNHSQNMHTGIYDISASYQHNYDHGPTYTGERLGLGNRPKTCKIFDQKLCSPLGIPAGPLLNSEWTTFYASFGFDIPVYKTVRSVSRSAHPTPNCVYVGAKKFLTVAEQGQTLIEAENEPREVSQISITNSFGMPSAAPSVWMPDIAVANQGLADGQQLWVSVTGTPGLAERTLTDDYAYTAAIAVEAGAKVIEVNYSCPNVVSGEGALYCDPIASATVSKKIRAAVGNTPVVLKLGYLPYETLKQVIQANRPFVDGFAAINTISMAVKNQNGHSALPGENRLKSGVCGYAIKELAATATKNLVQVRQAMNDDFVITSVGGVMTASDIQYRLDLGADVVMTATAAMWDPLLASRWQAGI